MTKKVLALGFLLGVMVVPFSLATDPTPAQLQANARLDQGVVDGAPIVYFENGAVVVMPPPNASPAVVAAMTTRMDALIRDVAFRGAWLEFLIAARAAGNAVCSTPALCHSFNLDTIPQLLLARPKLVQALATGVIPPGLGEIHPMGSKEIIERTYGEWLYTCKEENLYLNVICWGGWTKDCDTSKPGRECWKDKIIQDPCAPAGGGEEYPADIRNNSAHEDLRIP